MLKCSFFVTLNRHDLVQLLIQNARLEHRFPLFSMPWEIHIADLMQDYCNEIISEKRTQDLRTESLTRALEGEIREKDIPVLEGFRGKSKTHFRNIGLYNTVLAIEDPEVFDQMEQLLSPLEEPALRQTLRCWLEHDGSIQKVAEELFLHRNTVNYRIQKIKSLVSMDTAIQKTRLLLAFYMNDVRPYL